MNRRTGIAAVLIVLVLGVIGAWSLVGDEGQDPVAPEPGAAPEAPPPERAGRKRPVEVPTPALDVPETEPAGASAEPVDVAHVRVVGPDGPDASGIEGATVLVVANGEELRLTTDAAGVAPLPERVVGPAAVWAWAPRRSTAHEDLVVLPGAEVRLVLPAGRRVRVRFVDGSGATVVPEQAGGTPDHVELVWNGALAGDDPGMFFRTLFGPAAAWRTHVGVSADAAGLQLERPVGPGHWRLFVALPSGVPLLSEPFRGEGDGDLQLELRVPDPSRTRRIRVVVDGSGEPLAGARVRALFEYGDDQAFLPGADLVTDARGEVVVPLDDGGAGAGGRSGRSATWWAEKDSLVGQLSGFRLRNPGPDDEASVLTVRPASVVEGEAYTSAGTPAAGAVVVSFDDGRAVSTVVADDGSYRLDGVAAKPRGRATTVILIEDLSRKQRLQAERVAVAPGETVRLVFGSPDAANDGGRLTVYMHAGEFPLAGVYVVIDPQTSGGKPRFGRTDVEGRIVMEGVPAGGYRLKVHFGDPRVSDDHSVRGQQPVAIEAGSEETLDFDLPDGAMRVRVFDAATGLGLTGAGVSVRPSRDVLADRFPGYQYRPGWAAFTSDEGEAVLLALVPAEDHELRVFADGYEPRIVAGHLPGTMSEPSVAEVRLTRHE